MCLEGADGALKQRPRSVLKVKENMNPSQPLQSIYSSPGSVRYRPDTAGL